MAQCSKCGSPLSDAQKFCGVCGTVAEQAAPAAATPPEGTQPPAATPPPVPTTPPAATPPPVPATPQAFTPPTYPPQGYQQPVYAPGGGYPNAAWQTPKKSSKGLWIGIAASVLVLAIAAILIFVVFWDQVSGGGDGGGGSYANAQERLAASWANSENAANASGSYDIAVTLETDTSAMSAEDQQMAGLFAGPITASGTFATSQSPTAVDLTVAASLFGQGIDAGVRLLDGKPYILFSGQWYETDPDTMQSLTDSGTVPDVGAIKDVLTNLAVDPSAWLKDLKEVGSEKIDGVNSVHLSGTPDLVKMITDVTVLMQSPEGQNLLDVAGSAGDSSGLDITAPTAEELADLQTQLDAMLQNATVDLWLSKEDNSLRKLAITMKIVPSAADASGDLGSSLSDVSSMFKSVTLTASVTLASGQPPTITAPESPLSYADLQDALSSDSGLLGMILGGGF